MKTQTIETYTFNELSADSKQNAIEWYRNTNFDYYFATDYLRTLKKGTEAFGAKLKNWVIDATSISYCNMEVHLPEDVRNLSGVRLFKYIQNNYGHILGMDGFYYDKEDGCPFTGMCSDEDFLRPIRAFMQRPDSGVCFEELLTDCCYSVCRAIIAEVDYQNTDAFISEYLMNNDYWFTKDGAYWGR